MKIGWRYYFANHRKIYHMTGSENGPRGLPIESHQCLRKYVEEIGAAAMLVTKRSAGVAPDVNLRERAICTHALSANKAEPILALKPRRDITRSPKQGYQWPHKINYSCPPKIEKKRY